MTEKEKNISKTERLEKKDENPKNDKTNYKKQIKGLSKQIEDLSKKLNHSEEQNKHLNSLIQELERDIQMYKPSHDILLSKQKEIEEKVSSINDQKNELKKYGAQDFILKILEPLEWFDKSLSAQNVSEEVSNWLKGFEMIRDRIINVMQESNVKYIDPEINSEPCAQECNIIDQDDKQGARKGHIISVARRGYKLYDRVIKPADVIVQK